MNLSFFVQLWISVFLGGLIGMAAMAELYKERICKSLNARARFVKDNFPENEQEVEFLEQLENDVRQGRI